MYPGIYQDYLRYKYYFHHHYICKQYMYEYGLIKTTKSIPMTMSCYVS